MSAEQPQPDSIVLARCIVASLIAHGVRDVVYSPGSRCAPFAYALAQAEAAGLVRVHVRVDERGAAFFAVGLARAVAAGQRFRPVALVGTSGGAIAEYHAGVAEAFHSRLPLIVVSADRPFEMRGVGASQTTEQPGIFASHSRGVWDIPAGTVDECHVQATMTRAVARAVGCPAGSAGPVQVNVGLRDPLVPEAWPISGAFVVPEVADVIRGESRPCPWDECVDASLRTVIVAGDGADPEAAVWAEAAGVPLLAEPSAGVSESAQWVPFQQAFLQPDSALGSAIEQVIVTGRPTLSRPVSRLLARETVRVVVVSTDPEWVDVAGRAAVIVPALAPAVQGSTGGAALASARCAGWLESWLEAAQQARLRVKELVDSQSLTFASVADAVWRAAVGTLVLGASNSIRAVDLVASTPSSARVVSNRGLAGIDGTIATAFGLARGSGEPVRALMGDLTFFHDVSSLAVTEPESAPDVHIVVVDDAGGGIFASLEHGRAAFKELYPRWFATQQRADISLLAAAYGAQYSCVHTMDELRQDLELPICGVRVTHVRVERPDELFAELKNVTTEAFS